GMYLTNDGIYFSLLGNDSTSPTGKSISNISLKFVDGNTQNLIGVHELQGKHNYIQSSKSVTDIPLYEKAKYESVYQGINAIVYGNSQNELEYDFVVAPNADASQIAVEIAGATKLEIDANGRLLVHTKDGTLWQDAPVLYQYNGAQKTAIDGKFVLDGNHLKFDIANYDHSKTLFIDPIFSYGSYVGEVAAQNQLVSSDTELAGTNVVNLLGGLQRFGIKIHNDDLYIAGETIRTQLDSPAFPVTAGSFDVTQNGSFDVFVAKLRPQGNGASDLIYSTYIGSVGDDKATMLDVNALGEVYVAGETSNPNGDFPTTLDAYDTTANGGKDVFVSKLSADGTTLLYNTLLGGSGDDAAYHIVVDANGRIYLTGETTSSDLPTTSGAFQTSNSGGVDVFVAKIDPSHTGTDQLVYATYYGGASNEAGYGLTIDALGNAYVVGKTIGTIPTTPNAFLTSAPGGGDGFLFKLDPTGTALLYGTYFGGTGSELIDSVALDPSGNVFIAGSTSSSNLSTNTAFDTTLGRTNNGQDAIVAKFKLNNGGGNNDLLASTYFGGGGSENAREIKVDANGNVFIVGFTSANDPVPTTGTDSKTITGAGTIGYFSKFDNNLSNLLFSTHFGAASGISNNNNTTAVSTFDISNTGQVALIGTTTRDLETSTGAFDENFNTGPDAVNPLVNIFIQSYSIGNTNQAPTNPTGFNLADIPEDVPSGSNNGTLVSDIVTGSGSTDSDSAPLGIAVTNAANTNGIWQFSTDNGASWNAIGSVSVANALLLNETDKIRFVSSLNFNGNDQLLGFKVWDKSSGTAGTTAITNNGETAFSVNAANALLDVTPINDAPDIVVPATKNIFQGDQIFFRNQDRISFSDIDIGGEDARVTLSVTHGTLTIAGSSTGLNFITGDGTNDTDMIFTGNLADINAAVSNLLFRSSSSNFSGTSTLTVNISDQGHTGATGPLETTKFVDIQILSFPQSQFAQEDINKPIQGISINNEFSSVDLLVLNGTLTLSNVGNVVISNNGSESVSISGNFNDINATLDTLIYKGNLNFNGGDGLLVSAIGLQEVINSAIAIFVNPVNDAPTNPENLDLPSLPEDVAPASNTGTLVSDIVTESGSTDVDSTPLGIAVTNAAITNGIWQFSTDNGANWNAIGIVSETNALLLNETDKIRFVPNANFNGNDQPLGFKVWDKSSGTAGSLANTSSSTAFSVNPANALLDVTPVNDAPTNPNNFDLAAIPEDILSGSNTGTLVSDIVTGSGSTDVDSALLDIAVTNATNTNGIWQFSIDNGASWNAIGSVSNATALLLNE
ncbi:MAG: SBBP repeat-containing protein, partial [Alphaproteobacteria bacterium]|nr:SBBP repeat-containing protein [Alphaproteobacteria bacterium]